LKWKWEGWEDEGVDVSSHCLTYRSKKLLEIERRIARSLTVENCLWKRPWVCRKTDEIMMTYESV